jgi:hypothetical protein
MRISQLERMIVLAGLPAAKKALVESVVLPTRPIQKIPNSDWDDDEYGHKQQALEDAIKGINSNDNVDQYFDDLVKVLNDAGINEIYHNHIVGYKLDPFNDASRSLNDPSRPHKIHLFDRETQERRIKSFAEEEDAIQFLRKLAIGQIKYLPGKPKRAWDYNLTDEEIMLFRKRKEAVASIAKAKKNIEAEVKELRKNPRSRSRADRLESFKDDFDHLSNKIKEGEKDSLLNQLVNFDKMDKNKQNSYLGFGR